MPEDISDQPRPASPAALFWAFNRLALQGFGGVLPVAQRVLVERLGWLTPQQYLELLSLSYVLPGPNIVNLGIILGDRHFGWRGAVAATLGLMLAPLALVLMMTAVANELRELPQVAGALHGMGIVAAGLILSTAIRLAPGLRHGPLGLPLALLFVALTVLSVGVLRWPLAAVVLGLGGLSVALAWRRFVP